MTVRLRILDLLRDSPPLLASQISWKLGLKLEVVSAHLGSLRRDGLTARQKVYHPTAAYRFGYRVIRLSQVFWTAAERRRDLQTLRFRDEILVGKRIPRRRPITGDMIQMIEDIRHAASQR